MTTYFTWLLSNPTSALFDFTTFPEYYRISIPHIVHSLSLSWLPFSLLMRGSFLVCHFSSLCTFSSGNFTWSHGIAVSVLMACKCIQVLTFIWDISIAHNTAFLTVSTKHLKSQNNPWFLSLGTLCQHQRETKDLVSPSLLSTQLCKPKPRIPGFSLSLGHLVDQVLQILLPKCSSYV